MVVNLSGLATYVNCPEIMWEMTRLLPLYLAGGCLLTGMALGAPARAGAQTMQYPPARKSAIVDDYYGTRVADPYRWLEDPDSPETRAWIEAENRLTDAYLAEIPARATLRERLTKLWNYPKYGTPFRKAGRYFFFKNDGLQNQSVLFTQETLDDKPLSWRKARWEELRDHYKRKTDAA